MNIETRTSAATVLDFLR